MRCSDRIASVSARCFAAPSFSFFWATIRQKKRELNEAKRHNSTSYGVVVAFLSTFVDDQISMEHHCERVHFFLGAL